MTQALRPTIPVRPPSVVSTDSPGRCSSGQVTLFRILLCTPRFAGMATPGDNIGKRRQSVDLDPLHLAVLDNLMSRVLVHVLYWP